MDMNLRHEFDPTEEQKARMLHAIRAQAAPRPRRRKPVRRMALALCAVLTVAVVGAVAGGTPFALQSRSGDRTWTDFRETAVIAAEIAPDMKFVERFSTGYAFVSGSERLTDVKDQSWNTIDTKTEVYLTYENETGDSLSLTAGAAADEDTVPVPAEQYEMRLVGDIPVYYRALHTITLPSGAQPTADEQQRFDAGEININYDAADTVRQESTYYFIRWTDSGTAYHLATYAPAALTPDDFFQMAAELIAA